MLADTASGDGRMRLPAAKVMLSKFAEIIGMREGYMVNFLVGKCIFRPLKHKEIYL